MQEEHASSTPRDSKKYDPDRLLQRKYLTPLLLGLTIGVVVHVGFYFFV